MTFPAQFAEEAPPHLLSKQHKAGVLQSIPSHQIQDTFTHVFIIHELSEVEKVCKERICLIL